MGERPLLIFDFDNTLVDTRGVGAIAIRDVDAFLSAQNLDSLFPERKEQFFREFERNLRAKGEDKSGRVDIETWRSRLWAEAAESAGEMSLHFRNPDSFNLTNPGEALVNL